MDLGDLVDVKRRFVGGLQFVFDLSGGMAEVLLGCAVDRVGLLLSKSIRWLLVMENGRDGRSSVSSR